VRGPLGTSSIELALHWVLAAVLTASAAGCVASDPLPPEVARGQLYQTGEPVYDRFFADLHALQVDLKRAPDEERASRVALARALGAAEDAAPAEFGARVRERLLTLRENGVRVRLLVDEGSYDSAAVATLRTLGEVPPDARPWLAAVEQAATAEAKLMVRVRRQRRELGRMLWLQDSLGRTLDRSFGTRSDADRTEVRRNLEEARAVILRLLARASEVADATRLVLGELEQATRGGLVCRPDSEPERAGSTRPRTPVPAEPGTPGTAEPPEPPDFEP
jgi:hypothetical protein